MCKSEFGFNAGYLYFEIEKYEKSVNYLQTSLGIVMSDNLHEYKKAYLSKLYCRIGVGLLKLRQYDDSLNYLKVAIRIIQKQNKFVKINLWILDLTR